MTKTQWTTYKNISNNSCSNRYRRKTITKIKMLKKVMTIEKEFKRKKEEVEMALQH